MFNNNIILFFELSLQCMEHEKGTKNQNTEERLKEAARIEFMRRGYAAAKIRDIAKAADTNLALLNYYFRSKEKLFQIVMAENVDKLFANILPVLNDTNTTLEEKLVLISKHYTEMLLAEPSLPIFVLNEIQTNPEGFGNQIKFNESIMQSNYISQLAETDQETNPVHHLITYLGMILFPFIMKPVMQATGAVPAEKFLATIKQREKLAPQWMMTLLNQKV
jgi:AcrR family transcriptional regulator